MKRLDTILRITAIALFIIMCLLSMAFASSEEAGATDAEMTEYEYEVTITPPEGWYVSTADVLIEITDVNGKGYDSASVQCPGESSWTDIRNGSSSVKISCNGAVHVRITDGNGELHEYEQEVECIDTTAPTVTAGIRDKVLHTEASDSQSGVYGVMVDDDLYTTLKNGELDLRIEDYANAGAKLDILAIDNMGNRSGVLTIDNPYYAPATPTPAPTATPKPTTTPAPTATPTVTHDPVIIYTGTLEAAQTAAPALTSQTTAQVTTPSASASTPVSTTVTHPVQDTTADETEEAPTPAPTTEPEEITIEPGEGFSDPGNAVTRDLLYDKHTNKQFITVQTRNGNTMYLVIDYDKVSDADEEQYQTYFLNPVDEADLLALLDDDAITALTGSGDTAEETPAVCTCTDKCVVGHIDTTCPVCRTDISKCIGVETITSIPEPTPEPEEETEPEPEASGRKVGGIIAVLLIFGGIGGGLFYFLKNKKSKPQTAGSTDFDDYDFGEDEDELNIPEEEEENERTSEDP